MYSALHMTTDIYTASTPMGVAYSISIYELIGQHYYIHIYMLTVRCQGEHQTLIIKIVYPKDRTVTPLIAKVTILSTFLPYLVLWDGCGTGVGKYLSI